MSETNISDNIGLALENVNENTTTSQIIDILKLIPKGDEVLKARTFKSISNQTELNRPSIKRLYNEIQKSQLKEEIQIYVPESKNFKMFYESRIDDVKKTILCDSGCFSLIETSKETKINYSYSWKLFKILGKYSLDISPEEWEWRFDFVLNGVKLVNRCFEEMKDYLYNHAFQGDKGKSNITTVLELYCDDIKDYTQEINKHCGFMETGWCLPPKHKFRYTEDIMNKQLRLIQKMMKLNVEESKARKYFRTLYGMTKMKHKEIIYSFFVAAPFYHCIKLFLGIMPQLALGGPKGSGKSSISKIGTKKIWGNCKQIESADAVKTTSRFSGAIAGSTFPVAIDDCEKLPIILTDILKTHATGVAPFKRKKGQKLVVDTILLSAVAENFNILPKHFKDVSSRDRLIYIEALLLEPQKVKNWGSILYKIPDGYIGKYLIESTKDWNIEFLMEKVPSFSNLSLKGTRSKNIAKIIQFGGWMIEKFFGIQVNLKNLKSIISGTKEMGTEQIVESIKHMALKGLEYDHFDKFRPTDWVRQPTLTKKYKKVHGMLIDVARKTELMGQFEDFDTAKRVSLKDLTYQIKEVWDDVVYSTFSYEGVKRKYIFIPSSRIIDRDMDLNEWYNLNSEEKEKLITDNELMLFYEEMEVNEEKLS